MAKDVTCVFCGERRARGKEHMIPRWLQIYMGGSMADHYMGSHMTLTPAITRVSRRDQPGESVVFGHVCQNCNGGWMNELEVLASRLLKDVITNGSSAAMWGQEECALVARWGFKTAAMINAGSNYRRIIPPEHFRYFHDEQTLPPGVMVDVGLSTPSDEPTIEWRQSQNFVILRPMESTMNQADHQQSYKITLAMGQLFVKVVFWPNPSCTLPADREGKAARIWPYSGDIVFDDRSSEKVIDQFDFGVVMYPEQVLTD